MGKSKKQHREKVAKRNAKILKERSDFQHKMEKLRRLITETAISQSNTITNEVESLIEEASAETVKTIETEEREETSA